MLRTVTQLPMSLALTVCLVASAQAAPSTFVCDYPIYADQKGTRKVEQKFELKFLVDGDSKKAYVLGNQGSEEVHIVWNRFDSSMTFVEITVAGNVMITTIDTRGVSVHSRHTVIGGELLPTQYYGACEYKP